jgi:hypothetical protein
MSSLDLLPGASQVWIFPLAAPLSETQTSRLECALAAFARTWSSHGAPVRGGLEIRHGRFVVAAAVERAAVSGCSIDGLFHAVADAVKAAGADLADTADIFYRDGERIVSADRPTFSALVRAGAVSDETVVFDNSVQTLADVRAGRWEIPFAAAWHARHFNRPRAHSAESAA